ncbi:replication restart DNA helicase PriA [Lachnospiraceae bacterium XBB2008]|nr:replication restart DNA helicase PriA [Lachnospiraceae bacterium XBB2008]
MTQKLYADIIIEISHEQLDRPFQYIIPDEMVSEIKVGDCVTVPFGRGNKILKGYCIEIKDHADYPEDRLKSVMEICNDQVSADGSMIALAWWIRVHFGGTMIQALKTVIPVKKKMTVRTSKRVDLTLEADELDAVIEECDRKHQTARLRILKALLTEPTLPYDLVRDKLSVSAPTLRSLESKGYIRITETEYYRNPIVTDEEAHKTYELSKAQQHIISTVTENHDAGRPGKYLIHGITGSGKTEVYIGIADHMVKRGLQVIVLIPEIALTYQTLLRFYKRFGDRVSVVNSSMSQGERYDQFLRAKKGDIDVIIGPRSALFTPFSRLGAIIIDEEHEPSYRSENTPRYKAVSCAEYISESRGVSLILGSATPSMESYYKALQGEYELFTLDERLTGGALPDVHIVDLREELRKGNRSVFSDKLKELMDDRLSRSEQIMLFINRRGVAGFISCRSCGHVIKCPHCDVSLTEHRGGRLVCHYCGHTEPMPKTCPECSSSYIAGFRVGTEEIEAQIRKMYPASRVVRMDADTTREKGSMETILRTFRDHEADILIGTQMIVKGHDFPEVTLVGMLAADMSLSVGDYRAAERTFALLTQAAGRAGRGTKRGEVVIQTYQPEHYSIVSAASQNYKAFYDEEIIFRTLASYPPLWHMLAVMVVSEKDNSGETLAEKYRQLADACIQEDSAGKGEASPQGYTIGPAPAYISRIKDRFRHVLYIKHVDMDVLIAVKDRIESFARERNDSRELTFFDFDP